MSKYFFMAILFAFFGGCTNETPSETTADQKPPNVLFIAVDDLRPELNCYGKSKIHSPNIDRLAAEGYLFERAYCNIPVCGASRASLMTGMRPRVDRFINYLTRADEDAPNVTSLPQHFRENGYTTASLGKIYHHRNDVERSWSKPAWVPNMDKTAEIKPHMYMLPENQTLHNREGLRGPPYERAEVHDSTYLDGRVANRAVRELQAFAKQETPFFLAVGFYKPHLPFNAPAKYWDLYPDSIIEQPAFRTYPEGAPKESHYTYGELRHYEGVPKKGPVSDEMAHKLIQGYYAATSYTDALVGQVMDELKRLKLDENTIVILWGDHGWSLNEHGLWCKHNTFNVAMQTPMLIKVPGMDQGKRIRALTEYVDIYPSLCELAGLPKPAHLQGDSFKTLLENPTAKGKEEIYARWVKSDAIKTDRYLYTEWFDDEDKSVARMLYDHETDPDETVNISEQPEHATLVAELSEKLRAIRKIQ